MSPAETNRLLAAEILSALHAAGVRTLCVCPGGRNAPLVLAADAAASSFEVISFFEERSAAFFALGRAQRDSVPVAVMTRQARLRRSCCPPCSRRVMPGFPSSP